MKFSDLQIEDIELWQQIQNNWNNKYYEVVINQIKNNLTKKKLIAEEINKLTDYIVQIEHTTDPEFKKDKIPCQVNQPQQKQNEVWFQIIID